MNPKKPKGVWLLLHTPGFCCTLPGLYCTPPGFCCTLGAGSLAFAARLARSGTLEID